MQEKKTLSHAVMTAKRMIRTNIFFKPSYCVYIPSLLFVSVWIGCFPQSALRKQISAHGERSTLTAEHRSKGKRDERTPFFLKNSSCTVTHCLSVENGAAQDGLSDNRTWRKKLLEQTFSNGCSGGCATAMEFFHVEQKKKKKPSQNRRKDSRAIEAAQPVGLVPVNECTWCLVHSPQACLHQGMAARRAKLYRPATPPDRPPPIHLSVTSQQIMSVLLKLSLVSWKNCKMFFFIIYIFFFGIYNLVCEATWLALDMIDNIYLYRLFCIISKMLRNHEIVAAQNWSASCTEKYFDCKVEK